MATPIGKAVLSKQVDKIFREKFTKQTEFWKELGELFVAMAGNSTRAELEAVKGEFPLAFEFVEDYI